jgi:hypothetical protein
MRARNESEERQTRKREGAGGAPRVEWQQEPARGTDHAFAIFNSSFTDNFDSEVA